MEVHQHTHSPRKKWSHYFWEFLMLFLAVFAGFLAENQREHIIEHRWEKRYMQSLLEDLQTDTLAMNRVYELGRYQKTKLDSLIELVDYKPMNEENVMKLYMLHGESSRFLGIRFEDRTSSQLKNAGGMRLIRNKKVSDTVRRYWGNIETIEVVRGRLDVAGENIADLSSRIFYNKFFIPGEKPLDPPKGIRPGAILIENDSKLLAQYINRMAVKRIRTNNYLANLERCNQLAVRLMELIRKEYHLE